MYVLNTTLHSQNMLNHSQIGSQKNSEDWFELKKIIHKILFQMFLGLYTTASLMGL